MTGDHIGFIGQSLSGVVPVERHLLWTPLDEDTCWQRLRDPRGRVRSTRDGFAVARAAFRPSFLLPAPIELTGQMQAHQGGTRLTVHIGPHPALLLVFPVMGMVWLFYLLTGVWELRAGAPSAALQQILFNVLIPAAAAVVYLRLLHRRVRIEAVFLLGFLREVLAAGEVAADGPRQDERATT